MGDNGNKGEFLKVVGLEGRRRSWDFEQTRYGRGGGR